MDPVSAGSINPLYASILAAFVVLATPLLTALANRWTRKGEREEDRKDRAEVASRAEATAQLLVASNKQVAEIAASTAATTSGQLKQIHVLVNDNLTTAIQEALDSKMATRTALRELVEIKKATGGTPTPEAMAAITTIEAKIKELTSQLEDRRKAAAVVADEQRINPVDQK